jgi:aconitate hydratase
MFYIDEQTIDYLRLTGREEQVALVENYAAPPACGPTPGHRAVRARAALRPVQRGAQHGRPVQPAQAPATAELAERGIADGQAGSGQGRAGAGPDARWRGDHRRHHQLHQHQQPAQRDRRRLLARNANARGLRASRG